MSFIDLMADHRWSEVDIVNRTEAMVREHFSAQAEAILARKVMGTGMGYVLTATEQAEVMHFQQVSMLARQAGEEARADMALLEQALSVEAAVQRLAQPPIDPVLGESELVEGAPPVALNLAELLADDAERQAALDLIDAAPQPVLDLVAARAAHRAPAIEETPAEPEGGAE